MGPWERRCLPLLCILNTQTQIELFAFRFCFFKTLMSLFLYRIFTNRDRYQPPNGLGRGGSAKTRLSAEAQGRSPEKGPSCSEGPGSSKQVQI